MKAAWLPGQPAFHSAFNYNEKCAISNHHSLDCGFGVICEGGKMFETIKKVCALNSEEIASKYLLMRGKEAEGRDLEKTQWITSQLKNIENLCNEHDIHPSFGIISSTIKDPDGKRIDVSVFVQTFAHNAPNLGELITDLAALFDLERTVEDIRLIDQKPTSQHVVFRAEYFVSSHAFFAVNLASGKLMNIEGQHIGGTSKETEGKATISLNLEIEPSMGDLVQEIVKTKLQEELDRSDFPERLHAEINERVKKEMKISPTNPFHEMDKIKEERSQVFDKFKRFDENLQSLLGYL
jgi:hypothetical protein